MLIFCGRSVETMLGGRGIVILYLVGAYAAAAAHYAAEPARPMPMVGASGAISAVLGAYAMLFGRNQVKVANPALATWLNALWLGAAWIGMQLLVGFTFETAGLAHRHRRPCRRLPRRPGAGQAAAAAQVAGRLNRGAG